MSPVRGSVAVASSPRGVQVKAWVPAASVRSPAGSSHGELARQYPETTGQPVRIQLDCVEPPRDEIAQITEHTAKQLDQINIGFRVNVLPPQ